MVVFDQEVSTDGFVAADHALFGEDDLPELECACAESAGTGEEIVFPHAVERIRIG